MLKIVETYCDENKLTINTDKTKCLIFNKTGRLFRNKFYLHNKELENVRSYKYLGFVFTPSGEIKTGLHDLRDRAFKAFMKLRKKMDAAFHQNVYTTLSLIEIMIKPILLYASDFWGCLKLPKDNPVQNIYMSICKQILGVQKQTTNIGVLLELGLIPLHLYAIRAAVKNWERLKGQRANELLMESYRDAENERLPWFLHIKELLEENGMFSFIINPNTGTQPFINKKLFQRLSDAFHQKSFEDIRGESNKLRTYALLKTEIGFENYLLTIKNPLKRILVTKFRLSNHNLMIEKGRHINIPKEMRFVLP